MQLAKDSFYVALRDRLAAVNPGRTVFLNGVTRPAVVVVENEHVTSGGPLPQVYYLRWGTPRPVEGTWRARRPMFSLECAISYWTAGTADNQGIDRGRLLAELDLEFQRMCSPRWVRKCDHSQSPPVDLGTIVYWTTAKPPLSASPAPGQWLSPAQPEIPDPTLPPVRLERSLALAIYFYPEADLA